LAIASHAECPPSPEAFAPRRARRGPRFAKCRKTTNVSDQFEVEIDDIAIHLPHQSSQLATELRLITVAMKISSKVLQRVGDEGGDHPPALQSTWACSRSLAKPYVDIPRMATMAIEMLREAIDGLHRSRHREGPCGRSPRR